MVWLFARQAMLVPGTEFLNTRAFLPKVLAANELKHDHMGDHPLRILLIG